jgi:hypothetical protein
VTRHYTAWLRPPYPAAAPGHTSDLAGLAALRHPTVGEAGSELECPTGLAYPAKGLDPATEPDYGVTGYVDQPLDQTIPNYQAGRAVRVDGI